MRTPNRIGAWCWVPALLAGLLVVVAPAGVRADALRDGRSALQAGRLDDAVRFFEQAASQGVAEGRAGVGLVHLRRHQLARAMEAFDLAERMDGQLAMAHYGKGEVLRQQEKYEEAIPHLERAVELDRRYPEAQLSLAAALTQVKRYPEAVASANRGLNWGPKWRPRFLIALGDIAAARDSLRDAGIWYTTAVQEAPDDPETHRALGDFYVKRGTFDLAYPEYQSSVALDSGNVDLHFALGRALYYGQRYVSALEEFQWVVARDPEFPAAQFALGELLYRSGKADPRRYLEARAPLEKYVQLMPDDPKGWSVLGRTYYFIGLAEKDPALAERSLEALVKGEQLGDKAKEMFTIRARLRIDRREYDLAAADYARAGDDLLPEDVYRLARMMTIQRNAARAESLYATIVDRDSTTKLAAVALNEIGKIRYAQAAELAKTDRAAAGPVYGSAIDVFERRLGLDPGNDEAYYYIGLADRELGRFPEALEAMRQAAAFGAEKPERHFWLGLLYVQADSAARAEEEFAQVVALEGGSTANKALALQQLGYYRLLRREYADAIDYLEQSAAMNPQDPNTLLWLAQGYQNSGNRARAAENYRKVLQLNPGSTDARNGLRMLEGGAK